ncbi:glycerophosphodiester phosphodiesterase [Alloalcanivorax xenomutans]|jgi:glycerophosphoryl diester phosphodiesterase|uniref:Glycerophosphodiester phosphodiesterase n=1 Tax=Alloalcanivorax xenomutans TaxID=1094342 RepID=A0A9Q3W6A0_9GAMM|nr:glycerophosphodiester phosphodiesterase [Alloalcanivorax xenomutans]ERS14594.1 glycerophosphoryl diester phosphodiesterase [Alcanivorax sp. PN-3]KYZ88216.1 glycerophosphodiester phosphodiesterase [Alcanivorax sp. KX64203]PHS59571.1 MAG: glycerophosphodiester phosphodiesterase [Alcanivorax sp.]ARB45511.1 glycerophosphodiester phosphodiesterase [Alloalcanivorax xenomutans]MCE7509299.1 glycerophosphodiester phosphodiesterase [Alloalcanivorax xenomutans]
MSQPFPTIVGHRGARGEAPENTLAGFQVAVAAGAGEIELDVRLSADGHLIVLHDSDLKRTTGQKGHARHFTLAQLNLMDARVNTPGWHSTVGVPSLREVVALCGPAMRFQFEVKGADRAILHQLAHQLTHMIDQDGLRERVVITSSHTGFLRMVATMAPHLERGYVSEYRYQQPTRRAAALGCRWLMPHHSLVSPRLMRSARRRGLKVSTWTVNDLNEAERLARLGVDGIITDFPTSFLAHFRGKDQRQVAAPAAQAELDPSLRDP